MKSVKGLSYGLLVSGTSIAVPIMARVIRPCAGRYLPITEIITHYLRLR